MGAQPGRCGGGGQGLSYRTDIRAAAEANDREQLENLVSQDRRAVRHLLGLSYSAKACHCRRAGDAALALGLAKLRQGVTRPDCRYNVYTEMVSREMRR